MITKGIRGAIVVESNNSDAIKDATLKLIREIFQKNNISKEDISHVIFTTTPDINADFPAKFARIDLGWDSVAMLCFHEMNVQGSLKMCLRVLIVVNCEENFKPQFVYLNGAEVLRK